MPKTDYASELMPERRRPLRGLPARRTLMWVGGFALFVAATVAMAVYLPRIVEARARYQRCRAGAEFNRAMRTVKFCTPPRPDCVAPPEAAAYIDDEYRRVLDDCKRQPE